MVIYYKVVVLLLAFMFSINVQADQRPHSDSSATDTAKSIDLTALIAAITAAAANSDPALAAATVADIVKAAIAATPSAAAAITAAAVTAAPTMAAVITAAAVGAAPASSAAAITTAAIKAAPTSTAAITAASVAASIISQDFNHNDHNDHNPAATHVTTGISGANSSESQTNSAAVAKDAIMSGFERAINACNGNSDCITAAAKKAEELAAKSSLGDENRGIKTEIEREVHTSVSPS
ncbi:MAG: hypothetical protein D0530_07285 [Methylococcales bacterium]|nr:MAG: hypothetical protein D0530_07285 [Methylococcales bacterium]